MPGRPSHLVSSGCASRRTTEAIPVRVSDLSNTEVLGAAAAAVAAVGGSVAALVRRKKANVIPIQMLEEALKEQDRREEAHHIDYRIDQRLDAIQQRLSRQIGRKAFSEDVRAQIVKELAKRELG